MRHKEFLIAFAEGKTVECRAAHGSWGAVELDDALEIFDSEHLTFRIAPRVIKVERWVNLRETTAGHIDERIFTRERNARDDAQFLRKDGYKVLADAVYLCTEVEVTE